MEQPYIFFMDAVQIRNYMILSVVIAAVVSDYLTFRIPNRLNLFGFCWGMTAAVADVFFGGKSVQMALELVISAAAIVAVMFPIYMIGGIGAGDVKLMGVVGLMLGFHMAVRVLVLSLFLGGVYGIPVMLRRGGGCSMYRFRLSRIHMTYAILGALILCIIQTQIVL